MQIQPKVRMKVTLFVSHLDEVPRPALDSGPLNDRVENGVNRLANVLNDDSMAIFQSSLQLADHILLTQTNNLQVAFWGTLLLFEPADALQLRIDEKWPSRCVADNAAVLAGNNVRGQKIGIPLCNLRLGRQYPKRIGIFAHWDRCDAATAATAAAIAIGATRVAVVTVTVTTGLTSRSYSRRLTKSFQKERLEDILHEVLSEGLVEWPGVRQKGTGKEDVAGEQVGILPQRLDVFSPPLVLAAQSVGKSLG